ncbi:hypothetical protein IP90_03171 [Luteimonas cucumeris]|uniref:Uncharacterized protein n=1 Tax=Luteimonas cucumeris TaxID=985012 RepID=A0A562KUS6_9GAMM|nr:hypothetical protein [Luteimonas cucumeris]TWH99180.1 hypothetical protein IP90_03171 [Luteimonas cucumeris]
MNIYTGLLFQQGHIQNPALALSLAGVTEPGTTDSAEASQVEAQRKRQEPCKPFHRGAIHAVCSTALSPFR